MGRGHGESPRAIEIRRAGQADAATIATMLFEAFVEYEGLYTPGGFAATTLQAEQVLARMREGPVWLAFREAKVLGTVAAVIKGRSVYMRGRAVLPAAGGLRIGSRLLRQ